MLGVVIKLAEVGDSGNGTGCINEVTLCTLCPALLVLGWEIMYWQANHPYNVTSHPCQVSLQHPTLSRIENNYQPKCSCRVKAGCLNPHEDKCVTVIDT